jgi:hypothetical protein
MKPYANSLLPGARLRFVLSAGRTGTVSIATYLGRLAPRALVAFHEPWPARWEHVVGNAVRSGWPLETLLDAGFRYLRGGRLAHTPDTLQVEVNPHLVSLLPTVLRRVTPLHVVHMVREPAAWVDSIMDFRASGWRRRFVDRIPLARPRPVPRLAEWATMSPGERMLWRWCAINHALEQLASVAASYELVRYEDLFGDDVVRRVEALRALHSGLGIDIAENPELLDHVGTMNARPSIANAESRVPSEAVQRISGDLARRYGYV